MSVHHLARRFARGGALTAAAFSVAFAAGLATAASADANTICTWAGTPQRPTGTFTITPGLTSTPTSAPIAFRATGKLEGDDPRCRGTMRFVGQIDAGSTCTVAHFEEAVHGLRGVIRAWGAGSLGVPQSLYDDAGQLVGVENAQIATQANLSHFADCLTPAGFTGGWPGMFSSDLVLFDQPVSVASAG
jgi:hypothetical protein